MVTLTDNKGTKLGYAGLAVSLLILALTGFAAGLSYALVTALICLMVFFLCLASENSDDYSEYRDELGLLAPIPANHGQRKMPREDFSFGPPIGEQLPGFQLRASHGATVDFHKDRGSSKAAVIFIRSAVW